MFKKDPDKPKVIQAFGGTVVFANERATTRCAEATGCEAIDACKSLGEQSGKRGCDDLVVGVDDEGVGAESVLDGFSDEEAVLILQSSNSGMKPDLSRRWYRVVKRAFDLVAASAAIVVLLVPGTILSAVICLKSPGASPLYSQLRVGRLKRDGSYKLFRMCKFRSMVPGADRMLDELKDRNEADGPLFKIRDDPRIIPGIGQFIRKHSIDELPQLINVLVGDMSLIGPRPALPCEVVQYDERSKRRLTVKCGCGGSWQSGGRSDSTFDDMVDCDLKYVDKCSPAYDLRLVLNTIQAMFRGRGAY